jgi:hypothetical protein
MHVFLKVQATLPRLALALALAAREGRSDARAGARRSFLAMDLMMSLTVWQKNATRPYGDRGLAGVFGWLQADTVAAVWTAAAVIHREKNTVEAAAAAAAGLQPQPDCSRS